MFPSPSSATSAHAPASLTPFFRPRSIAVVGASATAGKLGNAVLRNLLKRGFEGTVVAVNSDGAAVEGCAGFRSLEAVPSPVDCVFLAIPAARAPAALQACAAKGVRCVVVGASGFAELGTEAGRALQRQLTQTAREAGMRLIGPNTNGLLDNRHQLSLGYNASHGQSFRSGSVSILSHSGALFDGIAKRLQGYGGGLSKFVAVGNEADVSMLELLEFLVDDPDTRVIGLVVEGMDDGARLRAVATRLHAAQKRVVVMKIGRSAEGAGAALAHSSRLAGSSRAWDALLQACGFASVRTVEALAGACALLERAPVAAAAERLLCVTTSGAGGALLADFAAERGLAMAPQWDTTDSHAARTIAALPSAAPVRHPIDMGSLGDWGLLAPTLEALEHDGYRGPAVVYAHVAPSPGMARQLRDALAARRARVDQAMAVLAPGGLGAEVEAAYGEAGIPVFHDTTTCFDSLAACLHQTAVGALPDAPASAHPAITRLLQGHAAGHVLSEEQSADVLRLAGVPMVPATAVHNLAECLQAADATGYPVVLKGMVRGVAHKHQAGLVGVGIADAAALQAEFLRQAQRARELGVDDAPYWLLQPMLRGRVELIAGVSHEPGLGHFLVFGLGGVHTELLDTASLLPLPSARATIAHAVAASRTGQLLRAMEPTGQACEDLVAALWALQELVRAQGEQIHSVDVNPLLLAGERLVAVDALVVTAGQPAATTDATPLTTPALHP